MTIFLPVAPGGLLADTFCSTGPAVPSGHHLYVGDRDELVVVDVAEASHPAIVGRLDPVLPGARVKDLDVLPGHVVALTDTGRGSHVTVVDVTDPHHPRRVGDWTSDYRLTSLSAGYAPAGSLALVGYGYTTAWPYTTEAGLVGIDLASPSAPRQVAAQDLRLRVADIARDGHLAVLGGQTAPYQSKNDWPQVTIWDTSLGDMGSELASVHVEQSWGIGTVAVRDGVAYVVAVNRPGIGRVDYRDPEHPVELPIVHVVVPGTTRQANLSGVAVMGEHLFVGVLRGVVALQLPDVTATGDVPPPTMVGYLALPTAARLAAADGGYLYMTGDNLWETEHGLHVVDARRPDAMLLAATMPNRCR